MRRQFLLPLFISYPVHFRRRHGRKIVPVGVVIRHFVQGIWLNQLLAVAIDDTIAQVDVVARDAHDPFHDKQTLFLGRKEHNNVIAADVAVRQKRPQPMRRRRELLPVHEYVVADQQRVLHRTGGNLKRLQYKCNDEQAGDQHSRQRGQEFHCRLARLFVHQLLFASDFFFFFFWHVQYPFQKFSQRTNWSVRDQRVSSKK